ncbi:MAG: hypothetical protein IKC23_08350 [Fibrobacter sp.]|nr:hypothetical protein [Fibrobacter sp.]
MQKSKKSVLVNLLKASVVISLVISLVACSDDSPTNSGENATPGISEEETTLTDARDGRTYKVVTIGPMVWMAENLNYQTENSRCFDDNSDLCEQYGRLYPQLHVPLDDICPAGWRLPSKIEAATLAAYGASSLLASGTNTIGFSALWSKLGCFEDDKVADLGIKQSVFELQQGSTMSFMSRNDSIIDKVYISAWPDPYYDGCYAAVRCVKKTPYVDPGSVERGELNDPRDGKTYKTVRIGNQNWMAENLNYFSQDQQGICYYNNPDYCELYGRLYYGYNRKGDPVATINSSGVLSKLPGNEGLCPDGWHVPMQVEWEHLLEAVGGDKAILSSEGSNDYGFSVLYAGYYYNRAGDDEHFNGMGSEAYFLSAESFFDVSTSRSFCASYISNFSVRCVQNAE